MSIYLMSQVWTRDVTHAQQSVLLAMADHAKDDGGDCYPSVARTAWKTGYKPRQVQNIMRELRELDVLVVEREGGGRGNPTAYRIDLNVLPEKPPYETTQSLHPSERVQSDDKRVQSDDGNHAIASAPESSIKPSEPPEEEERAREAPDTRVDQGSMFEDDRPPDLPKVREHLHAVARLHKVARPSDQAIVAAMGAFPQVDAAGAADAMHYWAEHGNGRRRKIKNVGQTFRSFLSNESKRPPASGGGSSGRMEQRERMREALKAMGEGRTP